MTSTRAIISIGAGVLALVVIGAVVVLLAEGRTPTVYPADSPEAAMQGYLSAWQERDLDAAYDFFSDEIQAQGSEADYERTVRSYGEGFAEDEAVYIDGSEGDGERVTLHLTVEHYSGGGPGSEVHRSSTTVPMLRQADGWKIDQELIGIEPVQFSFGQKPF